MLEVIKPITNENTFKHIEPIKQTNNILIFIKYEYLSRYGDPGEELYDIKNKRSNNHKTNKRRIKQIVYFCRVRPRPIRNL